MATGYTALTNNPSPPPPAKSQWKTQKKDLCLICTAIQTEWCRRGALLLAVIHRPGPFHIGYSEGLGQTMAPLSTLA